MEALRGGEPPLPTSQLAGSRVETRTQDSSQDIFLSLYQMSGPCSHLLSTTYMLPLQLLSPHMMSPHPFHKAKFVSAFKTLLRTALMMI